MHCAKLKVGTNVFPALLNRRNSTLQMQTASNVELSPSSDTGGKFFENWAKDKQFLYWIWWIWKVNLKNQHQEKCPVCHMSRKRSRQTINCRVNDANRTKTIPYTRFILIQMSRIVASTSPRGTPIIFGYKWSIVVYLRLFVLISVSEFTLGASKRDVCLIKTCPKCWDAHPEIFILLPIFPHVKKGGWGPPVVI